MKHEKSGGTERERRKAERKKSQPEATVRQNGEELEKKKQKAE